MGPAVNTAVDIAMDIAMDIAVDNFVDSSLRGKYHEEIWRTPTQLGIGTSCRGLLTALFVFHVKHWQSPFGFVFATESDVNS